MSILFVSLIFTQIVLGQSTGGVAISGSSIPYDSFVAINDFFNKVRSMEVLEDVEGTPFLFDHWSDGRIVMGKGQLIRDIQIKFNIYTEEVMIKRLKHGDSVALKVDMTNGFFLWDPQGRIMEFENFKYYEAKSKRLEEGIFQKLHSGTNKLLIKRKKVLKEFDLSSPANTAGGLKNTFLSADDYFLLMEDELLMPLKRTRKGLENLYPGKGRELREYLKREDLNLKTDQDLVKAVTFMESN